MFLRSFTRREKVLLVVLAVLFVAAVYVLVVHYPLQSRMAEIEARSEEVEMDIELAQIRAAQYQSMKASLDEIFLLPEDELTYLPAYDNLQTLMVQLNQIFASVEPQLSFDAVAFDGSMATRTIRFSFLAPSYEQARAILSQLTKTGYRSLLDSLSLTPDENSIERDAVDVSGAITFYEILN